MLLTDDRQFGIKNGLGCIWCYFYVKWGYWIFQGYTVDLDISKAFECVNYYKSFASLIKDGLPKWVIAIIINWYSKLQVSVRWKTASSIKFNVDSGVRLRSSFSPAMFIVFAISFITNLRVLSVGCNVNGCHIGCLMHADDLILLTATVNVLQARLNCCYSTSTELRLPFSCAKLTCTAIGSGAACSISWYAVRFQLYFLVINF